MTPSAVRKITIRKRLQRPVAAQRRSKLATNDADRHYVLLCFGCETHGPAEAWQITGRSTAGCTGCGSIRWSIVDAETGQILE